MGAVWNEVWWGVQAAGLLPHLLVALGSAFFVLIPFQPGCHSRR
jgi:hypothetical protein